MVSDYHGNQQGDTLWYKALYVKIQSTRQEAAELILNEVPYLKCYEGKQHIYWGAELASSNRPPSKKHHQVAVPNQRKVVIDGPNGIDIDISTFKKIAIESVPAMAVSNVPLAKVSAFAQSAAQGVSRVQSALPSAMQFKLSYDEFCGIMNKFWFPEDWPPIMHSPFVNIIGVNVFADRLDLHQSVVERMLCACCLPAQGLTLGKAKANFNSVCGFKDKPPALETVACFNSGQICIMNEEPFPSRLGWDGFADPIKQDASNLTWPDELPWEAHYVNFAQFLVITDDGLIMTENSHGLVFQQHVEKMDDSEIHQFNLQYFNRVTRSSGQTSALKDSRAAMMLRAQSPIASSPVSCLAGPTPGLLLAPMQLMPAPVPPPSLPAPMQQTSHQRYCICSQHVE